MRTKADFGAMQGGRRYNRNSVRLVYRRNQLGFSRLGMAVSKKFGNAVQRNQAKRQMREVFRTHPIRSCGIDILAIPRGGAVERGDLANDFASALAMIRDRQTSQGKS